MIAVPQEPHLDRLSALIDAAAARADDRVVLFDFVLAISELWSRLGLRDPFVDAQLNDADNRMRLAQAARQPGENRGPESERLAFYALRTLAAFQTVVEVWRQRPALRRARESR